MQRSALCRSRRELSNEYLLAKFGFDAEENEPCQVCPLSADRSHRSLKETEKLFDPGRDGVSFDDFRQALDSLAEASGDFTRKQARCLFQAVLAYVPKSSPGCRSAEAERSESGCFSVGSILAAWAHASGGLPIRTGEPAWVRSY